ncbi:hypothetical protein [Photobacterium damselae]|uniref:hypothetical protein n=1 Tax=Photobacterium damselae TaxID=38293 RepID=UPI0040690A92
MNKVLNRKQSREHVSHTESGKFINDAILNFSKLNEIEMNNVVAGRYHSGQGKPNNRQDSCEI